MTIDEDALRKWCAQLQARVAYLEKHIGLFVDDRDLDAPKGNPTIRFMPRGWRGTDFKGKKYSEASPEFLEVLAEALQWSADHPKECDDPKRAKWNALDAMRARSWARRLRAGGAPKPTEPAAAEPAHTNGVHALAPPPIAVDDIKLDDVQIDDVSMDEDELTFE